MMTQDEKLRLVLLAGLARGLQALYDTGDRDQILRVCAFCDRLVAMVAGTAACKADYRSAQYDLMRHADEYLIDIILGHILTADSELQL